jgi:molecular chaperone GrpE
MNTKKDWENIGKKFEATAEENQSAKPEAQETAVPVTNTTNTPEQPAKPEQLLEHPPYVELEAKLTEAEAKANDYFNKLLRSQAELENILRRTERDIANAHKYSLEKFAFDLLPVIDNLERCLGIKIPESDHLKDFYAGIELTLKMFLDSLQKYGITVINPLEQIFDPTFHTAIKTEDHPSAQPNTVIQVLQKGYLLKDRLLRPALVIVAKGEG